MKKIQILLVSIMCFISATAQINTDRVMIIGRNALYYEDYILAIQYFNQVIQAKPYLAEPYFFRAIGKYYLEDMKGTEDDCTLALERNPFMTRAYQLRADARQGQEKYEDALTDYKKALSSNPRDKFSLINTGIVYMQLKDYDEAESSLNRLSDLYPKYLQGYLVKAAMYIESGDTLKAFDNYNYALGLDKYDSQTYSLRGLLYYHTHQYDSALVDLTEAINIDPLYVGNYINRGLIKYSLSDLRGAMQDYDIVIDKEPNNIIARFNRGLLKAQVGDDNSAIEDFDVVLKFEPKNYMAIYNRAFLRSSIGDHSGAIADMTTIIDNNPDFYNAYYARAQIKRDSNDLKGADKDYEKGHQLELLALKDSKSGGDKSSEQKTREKSDDDLDKFNLLVVADKSDEDKTKYQNERRGRVQDRNVSTDIEPKFVLSFYEKTDDAKHRVLFSRLVEDINSSGVLSKVVKLTNDETSLNSLQIEEHFNSINNLSEKIANDTLDAELYFARAIDFMLVQDYQSSIDDLAKAIYIKPNFTLAYFNQAVAYEKQLELKDYSIAYEANDTQSSIAAASGIGATTIGGLAKSDVSPMSIKPADNKVLEYEMILRNYNKVIELNPEFPYSYYNRAGIKYAQKDFRGAILDYNEAIRQNPSFSEAYYNRALARFQIGDKEKGLEDMRKAGEGGIMSAYGIIKRMSE